jgi:hypothetical protein
MRSQASQPLRLLWEASVCPDAASLVVLAVKLGLTLARQVSCHLSYSTSPFCFGYF